MILKQLSDRIYYLPHDEKYDRPTLGYIKGDSFSVMIDSGSSKRHLKLFNEGLEERNLPSPKYSIITHWHWDHTFAISSFNGDVIANEVTNAQLEKMQQWKWTEEAMQQRLNTGEEIEFCDTYIRVEYPNRDEIDIKPANKTFNNELLLDLGNVHCKVMHVGGPHSEDSNLIYIPEEKTLFVGDADCGDFYNGNGQYDQDKLKEYLDIIKKLDYDIYIHGHVAPMSKIEAINMLEKELK